MSGAYNGDALAASLNEFRRSPIGVEEKGFGIVGRASPTELAALAGSPENLNLTLPLMVIRDHALDANLRTLAQWCSAHGALLAPHAKTTMSPQIVGRQLEHGAWAITIATFGQLRTLYEFGVRRFLVANEITDRVSLRGLAALIAGDPTLDVACYVDSEQGVRLITQEFAANPGARAPSILLEFGAPNGRTGVRSIAEGVRIARLARESSLNVVGVAGFEGSFGHDRSPEAILEVRRFCERLCEFGVALADELRSVERVGDGFEGRWIVSAGGSLFFDIVADTFASVPALVDTADLVIRSGGYVLQDFGYLGEHSPLRSAGLEPAAEVWAVVLSRPEPGLAFVGAGKRDLPFDLSLPVVLGAERAGVRVDTADIEVIQLDDQHCYLRLPPACDLTPGDLVRLGGAHPCTLIDRWRRIAVLDDHDRVVDIYGTYF